MGMRKIAGTAKGKKGKGCGLENEVEMHQAWAGLVFDNQNMYTTDGKQLRLLGTGSLNHDQGPDFLAGRISLDGVEHHGDIELHLDSRDWYRHGHDRDTNYNSVVLHVVMDANPCPATRLDGTNIPTVTLAGRFAPTGKEAVRIRMDATGSLPCSFAARQMQPKAIRELLQGCGHARLDNKLARIRKTLDMKNGDWEEAAWVEVAAAIGGPVNGPAFRELAGRLPYRTIRKYVHQPIQCEALLFGAAGLLEDTAWDEYHQRLGREWAFLSAKHGLGFQPELLRQHRMRPASFPSVRLAQAAALLLAFPCLQELLGPTGLAALMAREISAGSYWRRNTGFGAPAMISGRQLGAQHKASLGINVLLPLGALYLEAHGLGEPLPLLEAWCRSLPAEDNKVTRKYAKVGWHPADAFESQAMIHLDRDRCSNFGCLQCPVWTGMAEPQKPGTGPDGEGLKSAAAASKDSA